MDYQTYRNQVIHKFVIDKLPNEFVRIANRRVELKTLSMNQMKHILHRMMADDPAPEKIKIPSFITNKYIMIDLICNLEFHHDFSKKGNKLSYEYIRSCKYHLDELTWAMIEYKHIVNEFLPKIETKWFGSIDRLDFLENNDFLQYEINELIKKANKLMNSRIDY
jgi:hypothetical protein